MSSALNNGQNKGDFADLALARRLEWAEAQSNIEFIEARRRVLPASGATWIEVDGTAVMYDGSDSPCTQTFGLGMEGPATPAQLGQIEAFYRQFGSPVFHEVSPLAGIATHQLLSRSGYEPVELSSVMFRSLSDLHGEPTGVDVRRVTEGEYGDWAHLSAAGWAEYEEFAPLMAELALVMASRRGSLSFLAEIDGRAVATAGLSIVRDVALLTGASTIPEARRQGAQRALLYRRLEAAAESGCALAMMCAAPGSASQRNAEREGFRIAYTRIKWQLVDDKDLNTA